MQIDNVGQMRETAVNQSKNESVYNTGQDKLGTSHDANSDSGELVANTVDGSKANTQKILEAIEKASGKVEVENKGLEFAIHEKTNQIIIRIINEDTQEVIKELPSEKILDMVAKMVELSGLYINEKR